jgi:hypothetical protein
MAIEKRDACICDLCGHVWLLGDKLPGRCARCKATKWNCVPLVQSSTVPLVQRVPLGHKKRVPLVQSPPEPETAPMVTSRRSAHHISCSCYSCKPQRP